MYHFLKYWGSQFQQVKFILQYLHTYPKILLKLRMEDLITPNDLFNHQEEWIDLHSMLTGEEQDFLKPYWIPVQKMSYNYFIDLSDSNYPIIEAFFDYFDEPYHWEKKVFIQSITNLMLAEDNKTDMGLHRISKAIEKYTKYF